MVPDQTAQERCEARSRRLNEGDPFRLRIGQGIGDAFLSKATAGSARPLPRDRSASAGEPLATSKAVQAAC
jgi:hypothetical protein